MAAVYSKRRNFFEKDAWEWRVEADALVILSASGVETRAPWRALTAVQLAFAPTAQKPWRHLMRLSFASGMRITIDNAHFAGIGNFENRSASFAPFARAALARAAAVKPELRVHVGAGAASYLLQTACVALAAAFLAFVLLSVGEPVSGWSWPAVVKLALILVLLPVFVLWLRRARPRTVAFDAIPEDALPKLPA